MHVAQEWDRFWDDGMHQTKEMMRLVAR
ncbi:hypothetical protein CK217_02210 [Mesorhizobium loti]|nr:hypothetical protein CK223_03780 [Mesorhizobium loti]PBB63393.1 hypothetical protein CK217_02210 [Mesorhizobium loti]